ncbi:unnamed protein product [Prorocentrum cordatum]|uniref:Uncharacterized protein n=1 Tax=Prorocentrum cordatum TaxID=2364126 RepID=A0ABN9PZF0_9DINO|nr:unnamed protein product [Polarella glacialis]
MEGRRCVAPEVPPAGREQCEAEWKVLAAAIRCRQLTPPATAATGDAAAFDGLSHYDGDVFKTVMDLTSATQLDHGLSRTASVTVVLDCLGLGSDAIAGRHVFLPTEGRRSP